MSSTTTKVIALSLGKGLTAIATIGSAMVMSRLLTEGQLGTYRQTLLAYDLIVNIFCLGVAQGVYFYLPIEKKRSRGVVMDGVTALIVLGLAGSMLLMLGRELIADRFSNPELSWTLLFVSALPLITLPAGLISSVLVTQDKVFHLTAYNVISNFCFIASAIFSCILWKEPTAIVISKVVVDILFCLVAFYLMFRALPKDEWRPDIRTMMSMVAFSLPLGLASIFGIFQINLDRLMVSSLCTPEQFAIYSNGALEIPLIGIITSSIATVIQPELRRKIATGKKDEAVALFRLSAEKSAAFLIPIMVLLFVIATPLMTFLFSEKYSESSVPFRIYLLLLPMRVVVYGSMMVALGLNRVVLKSTAFAAATNLLLGYVLVTYFGTGGASVATLISTYFIICGWNLFAISKAIPCKIQDLLPFRKMWNLLFLTSLAALPICFIRILQPTRIEILEIALSSVIFFLSIAALSKMFRNELIIDCINGLRCQLSKIRLKSP